MKGFTAKIKTNTISEQHATEEYGSWHCELTNEFHGITLVDKHPDVVTSLDINIADAVYVVWLESSSGDSFGWGINNNVEIEGVFLDKSSAIHFSNFLTATADLDLFRSVEQIVEQLKADKKLHPYIPNITIELDDDKIVLIFTALDGQQFNYRYFQWVGYFDELGEVHIDEAIVE